MEDYACLCINANGSDDLISHESKTGDERRLPQHWFQHRRTVPLGVTFY